MICTCLIFGVEERHRIESKVLFEIQWIMKSRFLFWYFDELYNNIVSHEVCILECSKEGDRDSYDHVNQKKSKRSRDRERCSINDTEDQTLLKDTWKKSKFLTRKMKTVSNNNFELRKIWKTRARDKFETKRSCQDFHHESIYNFSKLKHVEIFDTFLEEIEKGEPQFKNGIKSWMENFKSGFQIQKKSRSQEYIETVMCVTWARKCEKSGDIEWHNCEAETRVQEGVQIQLWVFVHWVHLENWSDRKIIRNNAVQN